MPSKVSKQQWAEWGRNPPHWLPKDTQKRLRDSLRPKARYKAEYYLDHKPINLFYWWCNARDKGEAKDKFWEWAWQTYEKGRISLSSIARVEGTDFFEPEMKPYEPPEEVAEEE